MVQHHAGVVITGAIKEISWDRIYQEIKPI